MSIEHYENFPVASILCPPALRPPVAAIYHFARTADDIADEGDASTAARLHALGRYRACLEQAANNAAVESEWPEVFGPLARMIRRHALPLAPLHALLDAFEQDCANPVYRDRAQLLDYCQRSANPIGRLLLHLYGMTDKPSLQQSDAVCTALQLINFWQDPSVDLPRGRSYFPEEDLRRFEVTTAELGAGSDGPATRALIQDLCAWSERLMREGSPLALRLPGRIGWELRMVVQGGLRILERIRSMDHCTLSARPALRSTDVPVMAWRAWRMAAAPATEGAPR